MSKLLVIFGATGQQGRAIIDQVLNDPELSATYKLRAVTRDISKPAAQALQGKGIEVVKGDVDDKESVKQAVDGAHTVFAMTLTGYAPGSKQVEIDQGKALADLSVAAGAHYLIWSSMINVEKLSGGKYKQVVHFDSKAEVEAYIRGLPIKSSFFTPGSFMQNFQTQMAPRPMGDGTYAVSNILKPTTKLPLIDISADTGKFVGAILAEPDKFQNKVFYAATKLYSMEEIVQTMSKVMGKPVKYNELPVDVFRGFLPPGFATELTEMLLYFRDFGYFGSEMEERVEWTAQQARGKLTTLEEYLVRNPPKE